MQGHAHILFEEAEIEIGPGLWTLINAEVYVDWQVYRGELRWCMGSWTGPDRVSFHPDMDKPLSRELNAYVQRNRKLTDYIESTIIERNGLVLRSENAEHRHSQREFV